MSTTRPRYSKDEFARRGDAIYARELGPAAEAAHLGKFAAIDIESGQFEIDQDELAASDRLLARLPAVQIWLRRIGSPYAVPIWSSCVAEQAMIRGRVNTDREAIVRLTIFGARQRKQTVNAVVDTGFDGFLTVPAALVAALNLRWHSRGRALLADGSDSVFDSYLATVLWNRRRRRIIVDEAETTPLIGMALLEGTELNIQVRTGGSVTIAVPQK